VSQFAYRAKSTDKALIEGVIEAESPSAAVGQLTAQGYFPLSISRVESAETSAGRPRAARIGIADLSLCLRQLSDLLDAGLPVLSAVQMAGEQTTHEGVRDLLKSLASDIREGRTLSQGMAAYPLIFPAYYQQLVHAGETGGMLGQVLARLADQAEKEDDLRSQFRAALAYPAFILIVGVATIIFLLAVIIPRLAVMFADFQATLPLPTRILLWTSNATRSYGWMTLFLIPISIAAARRRDALTRWKGTFDRVLMKVPGLRGWVVQQETIRFTQTMGALLENGVPILQAVEIATRTLGNSVVRAALAPLSGAIGEGRPLSRAIKDIPIFPPYVSNLVSVGEEGGKLDKALIKIAETYERQSQRQLKTVMSLLEPALILGVGLVLGATVVSIMLPIFEMNTLIH
jgi:type II secretory pathway component PulF